MSVHITAFGVISSLGVGIDKSTDVLFSAIPPELSSYEKSDGSQAPVRRISYDLPMLDKRFSKYECRNNRIASAILKQIEISVKAAMDKYGPKEVAVVAGSSTSGLDKTEKAFKYYKTNGNHPDDYNFETQHSMGSLSEFIAKKVGAEGPAYTISTACSSAAKAMISAADLIKSGVCKAVITGGVDTLCDLTVNGFSSLGQLSEGRLNSLSKNRSGLNIGEGGALFLFTAENIENIENLNLVFKGGGESMDAYHISAPHPEGLGAKLSMERALKDCSLVPAQISYINLHGTATKANDAMESKAVNDVFGSVLCSSTKSFTGHCLGASGAVEAAICCLSLNDELLRLPPHIFDGEYDEDIELLEIVKNEETLKPEFFKNGYIYFLSNSFAFGGNNCSIIIEKKRAS
ncbi:MAG: beta-ketoacyl-ACP synthase [Deltaproteobacteria bacterium]|nr:beta-ketoacyl-ACP synthase [Deltaproteobacteria bacterium]